MSIFINTQHKIPEFYNIFNVSVNGNYLDVTYKIKTTSKSKDLIYIVCYCHENKEYLTYLRNLLSSIYICSSHNRLPDILIITNSISKNLIHKNTPINIFNHDYLIYDEADCFFDYACARSKIFKYDNILQYEKVLYLDCDILCLKDINKLFDMNIEEDKIYGVEEGDINSEYHTSLFSPEDKEKYKNDKFFSSGIMLMKYSDKLSQLFITVDSHIEKFNKQYDNYIKANDQPFFVYHATINNMYDNTVLKNFVSHNNLKLNQDNSNIVLIHFPGYKDHQIQTYDQTYTNLYTSLDDKIDVSHETKLFNKVFNWYHNIYNKYSCGNIEFLPNNILKTTWGYGKYQWINNYILKCNWGWSSPSHYFLIDSNYDYIYSYRPDNNHVSKAIV